MSERQCKKQGFHSFNADDIQVLSEDFYDADIEIQCRECGASVSMSGYWDVEDIDEDESDKPILEIIGTDGNAFTLLAKARKTARDNDMDWKAIEKKATSGDYNNLLRVLSEHFEVV